MSIQEWRQGNVAVLRFERPEARNAIDAATAGAVERALDELEQDDSVHVVVLTGAGDQAFSAGADLKAFSSFGEGGIATERGGFAGIVRRDFPKPLLAAVNGYALAGGCEIVLACDLVVAADHARFGLPEVKRALFAGGGGTIRLPGRVGLPVAMELILTGDSIDAHRAYELGLVNVVVRAEALMEAALALAQRVADNPPGAVRLAKRVARGAFDLMEREAWKLNDEAAALIVKSSDAIEGARAFAEKRDATWKR